MPWSELCDAAEKCEPDVIHAPTPCRTDDQQKCVGASGIAGTAGRLRVVTDVQLRRCTLPGRKPSQQQKLVQEALGTNHEFVDEAVAERASEGLTDKGVKVSADGQITMTDWAEQMVNSGPWRAHLTTNASLPVMRSVDGPTMRVAGRIVGPLGTIEATRLWKRAGPHNCWNLEDLVWGPPGRCDPTYEETG